MRFSRSLRVALVLTSLLVAFSAATVLAGPYAGRSSLSTVLTGAAERPGPGDPNGSGGAEVSLSGGMVCYRLWVNGIATPTAAHIHVGDINSPGPVVVPLRAPVGGSSQGCVAASTAVINAIEHNPSGYYVNVHNAEYPAGAVRGQLR
jgi:hypothetical protein